MDDYISASEITEFIYCHRAWWLKKGGMATVDEIATATMDTGTVEHEVLEQAVVEIASRRQAAWQLLAAGVALVGLLLVIWLMSGGGG